MKPDYKPIIMMSLTIAVLIFVGLMALVMLFEMKITIRSITVISLVSLLFGFLGAIDIYKE